MGATMQLAMKCTAMVHASSSDTCSCPARMPTTCKEHDGMYLSSSLSSSRSNSVA